MTSLLNLLWLKLLMLWNLDPCGHAHSLTLLGHTLQTPPRSLGAPRLRPPASRNTSHRLRKRLGRRRHVTVTSRARLRSGPGVRALALAPGCYLRECRCFYRGRAPREGYSMYHSSSQKRHWTFVSEEQLARLRADANRKFKCKAVANGKVRSPGPRASSCATLNLGLLFKSRFACGLEACRALAWLGQCRQGLTRQPSPGLALAEGRVTSWGNGQSLGRVRS